MRRRPAPSHDAETPGSFSRCGDARLLLTMRRRPAPSHDAETPGSFSRCGDARLLLTMRSRPAPSHDAETPGSFSRSEDPRLLLTMRSRTAPSLGRCAKRATASILMMKSRGTPSLVMRPRARAFAADDHLYQAVEGVAQGPGSLEVFGLLRRALATGGECAAGAGAALAHFAAEVERRA